MTALAVARVIEQARGPWQPPTCTCHRHPPPPRLGRQPAPSQSSLRHPSFVTGMNRSPSLPLIVGLVVSLVTIAGMGWYTVREVRTLRDEQTAISERNRRDSLQLIRIQSNLATVATALRDMADRVEPYPVIYWRQTFDRLRADLDEAIALENTFSPAERPAAQQQRLRESVGRFWALARRGVRAGGGRRRGGRAGARADQRRRAAPGAGRPGLAVPGAQQPRAGGREPAQPRGLRARRPRDRRAGGGAARARRADRRRTRSGPTAAPSRRSPGCRTSCARSRGACCASRKTCSSRFRASCTTSSARCSRPSARCSAASSATCRPGRRWSGDVEEVLGIAQQTLERIRVQSRLLHPTVLDDFGLEKARGVVRRAVRPPARHRHALRGRRADRGRPDRRSTSTSTASCRKR